MKYLFIFTLLFFSCSENNKDFKRNDFCIKEFFHIKEVEDNRDGYTYSNYENSLDSIEVIVFSEILGKKNISYFISNENKLFYRTNQILSMGEQFILSRELADTIIARKLPKSKFVTKLAQDFGIEK